MIVTAFTLVIIFGLVGPAFAEVLSPSPYTITTGKLGGADYILYMPTNWNGRLIVGCPGYNFYQNPQPELFLDPIAKSFASNGYAVAVSNYNGGERAWLLDEGIIRIHQLTEYLIDNYHVTGKIFLVGGSMGGGIAVLLGEKYPQLYSGVLDICGTKSTPTQYEYGMYIATHSVDEIRAYLGAPSTVPNTALAGLKTFFQTILTDRIEQNHGTIDERPQAYAKENTLLHADIQIPVISVFGGIDRVVPLQVQLEYGAAVGAAGQSSLYRMYIVPTGGHLDATVMNAVPEHLTELIAWSDSLT